MSCKCFPVSPSITANVSQKGAVTKSKPPSPSMSVTSGLAAKGNELMSVCQSFLSLYGHLKKC